MTEPWKLEPAVADPGQCSIPEPWKPQAGKPAMTGDGKALVTDLEAFGDAGLTLHSRALGEFWSSDGRYSQAFPEYERDLIEPTAAILAAHGIDADGKPLLILSHGDARKKQPEDEAIAALRLEIDRWHEAYIQAAAQAIQNGYKANLLREFADFVKTAPVSSGVCCCGDPIDGHTESHNPVDQWDYSLSKWLEKIDKET